MNIKSWIKRIPLIAKAYRKVATLRMVRSKKNLLKQLKSNRYSQGIQIRQALISLQQELPQPDRVWKDKIEAQRQRLLNRNEPLDDGTLGQAGLYDSGISIKNACMVSKPPRPALLLFLLTRAVKPANVIELGTNVGISSAYIGAALKDDGQNGRITTLDSSPYRQRLARQVHTNLGIDNISYVQGLFTDTLRPTLEDLGSIDLAFIDGHHQYQPTLDYFQEILKFSNPDTVFVFDDIRWSKGMKKAWAKIRSDKTLGLIADLSSVGICTRRQNKNPKRFVSAPVSIF